MHDVQVPLIEPEKFREVLAAPQWDALRTLIDDAREDLAGKVVWNVNSTSAGGGVAEMLLPLIGYCRAAGVDRPACPVPPFGLQEHHRIRCCDGVPQQPVGISRVGGDHHFQPGGVRPVGFGGLRMMLGRPDSAE